MCGRIGIWCGWRIKKLGPCNALRSVSDSSVASSGTESSHKSGQFPTRAISSWMTGFFIFGSVSRRFSISRSRQNNSREGHALDSSASAPGLRTTCVLTGYSDIWRRFCSVVRGRRQSEPTTIKSERSSCQCVTLTSIRSSSKKVNRAVRARISEKALVSME
ncbi:hypothetical protein BDV98DRAFT_109840 [Pterulicium gracile]|uniref:Uncharacterized protein n=1 Tax=Pterulicium gracile TaxID=1884261 RepID=A0A5C3PZ03_9AGAR|nr:hypothetical protein BDV98DRAFT_109840 [Pterula gracilis]